MDTKKLKQKILDLAIRGKLVPQDPNDEPASVLLEQIYQEKERLIKEKKIKRDKNESQIYRSGKSYYEKRGGVEVCIDYEIPFEIPESWEWVKGVSIMNQMSTTYPQGDVFKYIDIESINNKKHKIEQPKFLPSVNAPSRANRYIKSGDTLFSMVRPYLENIAFVDSEYSDCIASTGFFVCSPNEIINPKYLFHLMTSTYVVMGLNSYMKGDNSPSISLSDIFNFYYPLPPLPEQQRIVESIEQAFALIDSIEADKSALSKAIKQAKAKVLDLAIRGKLVPQDPNDEPASVLLERIKAERQVSAKGSKKQQKQPATTSDNSHYPFDIPSNWVWCKFGDISDYGKCINAQPEQIDSNDWVLDLEDIEKDTGRVLAYITHKERKSASSKHIFKKGQLLYSKLRPYLNKVVVAEFDGFCTSEIIPIDFKGYIAPKYGQAYLMSPFFLEYANILSYGVKMPRMGTDDGKKANIPLPPFAEQQRITAQIDKIFRQINSIEEALKA